MRFVLSLAWICATAALAQTFDVASIRPHDQSKPMAGPLGLSIAGNRVSALNVTPVGLLTIVYDIKPYQVLGFPQWSDDWQGGSYDISAIAPEGTTPTLAEARVMFGKLLAERFRLAMHEDTKEFPVYTLAPVRSGHKLTASKADAKFASVQGPAPENRNFGILMQSTAVTMAQLANQLNAYTDRPVLDRTNLEGGFDYTLKWLQEGRNGAPTSEALTGGLPTLFTALKEQLGLTLEPTKAAMKVIVVDHIARPTDN
jgi:uncharacterized protein (TIGR03435 family)